MIILWKFYQSKLRLPKSYNTTGQFHEKIRFDKKKVTIFTFSDFCMKKVCLIVNFVELITFALNYSALHKSKGFFESKFKATCFKNEIYY